MYVHTAKKHRSAGKQIGMRYEMSEFHLYRRLALFGDKHGSWRFGATMYSKWISMGAPV